MKLATRINSFLPQDNQDLKTVFAQFHQLGLTHVDLNYPEHVTNYSATKMKALLEAEDLQLNGMALRFKDEFLNGDLGNTDTTLANKAIQLCQDAADYCREAGGQVVTVWMAHDGFDYSFQIDYLAVWNRLVKAFQAMADYAPDIKFSIEYKPFQPRGYAFVDSMGIDGMMLAEINRPNVGVTLDYCHMLMKHENPAMAADIFASRGQLFGIHLNDGYGLNDDGLMIGTASPFKTLEFLYYIKKHHYDGMLYFDTFPVIEQATAECEQNIKMIVYLDQLIDQIGLPAIEKVIAQNDAIAAHQLMMQFLSPKA
ncbi:sugar phosphate isomerase/epimerase family protein [Lactiplantibacillus daowaiensis]|uniref:Sugar phosphate isomerase/epimerase family protein n=1 Tax=Lactiplantibacillus daowaiensis TaxID=2559918 RepID=A0ABW1S2X7_9LACO|nr:TIM barrel protein [Lactiplantibacillus daowaiensis]